MRPVNLKKLNRRDGVARRHLRFFVFKIVAVLAGLTVVVVGLIYFLFFSRIFDVRELSFNGLDTISSDVFREKIDKNLNQKIFMYLPRKDNIFFVNTGKFEKEFASAYPAFKSVNVRKKLFHGLVFDFLERKPVGIWCFVDGCSYFDNEKVIWGQPAKSSGFIFLTVEDHRSQQDSANAGRQKIEDEFFEPIMEVAKSMPGEIKNIIIPENSFNEFKVYTTDYYIIFAIDTDIQSQLDVLKIFMKEKSKDSGFKPQYIDLRIEGRVYYK